MSTEPTLHAIIGPTASGKGSLARVLAERLEVDLLAADSMKVYRGLDVGTAKPSAAERERLRFRLMDLVEPTERFSVARYLEAARAAEAAACKAGRLPLYVGGSALYLKALRQGLFAAPPVDPAYRRALEEEAARAGSATLHARLRAADPEAARRIHPNDRKRVIRALEVVQATGRPISSLQTQFARPGRPARWLGLRWPRPALDERIAARVDRMMAAGLLEEVRRLEAGGRFGPTSGEAIGYRELRAHLRGEVALEEAVQRIKLRTRQFARRQATWFRSFADIHWLDLEPGMDPARCVEAAVRFFSGEAGRESAPDGRGP